jgi:hypothetical protein
MLLLKNRTSKFSSKYGHFYATSFESLSCHYTAVPFNQVAGVISELHVSIMNIVIISFICLDSFESLH